jgi:hypothetical protein
MFEQITNDWKLLKSADSLNVEKKKKETGSSKQ